MKFYDNYQNEHNTQLGAFFSNIRHKFMDTTKETKEEEIEYFDEEDSEEELEIFDTEIAEEFDREDQQEEKRYEFHFVPSLNCIEIKDYYIGNIVGQVEITDEIKQGKISKELVPYITGTAPENVKDLMIRLEAVKVWNESV